VSWFRSGDLEVSFPFAGVMSVRPYPPTGLTTARWRAEVPTALVDFAGLWLTQDGVDILALFGHSTRRHLSDTYPHVVAWQGMYLLEDGHCRVVRAALTTPVTAMTMRLFHCPDW
jgi:hypothetical protein